jgi:hypothetical protein
MTQLITNLFILTAAAALWLRLHTVLKTQQEILGLLVKMMNDSHREKEDGLARRLEQIQNMKFAPMGRPSTLKERNE